LILHDQASTGRLPCQTLSAGVVNLIDSLAPTCEISGNLPVLHLSTDAVWIRFERFELLEFGANRTGDKASGGVNMSAQTLLPHKTRTNGTGSEQHAHSPCTN
jgi:hypothetical protein